MKRSLPVHSGLAWPGLAWPCIAFFFFFFFFSLPSPRLPDLTRRDLALLLSDFPSVTDPFFVRPV